MNSLIKNKEEKALLLSILDTFIGITEVYVDLGDCQLAEAETQRIKNKTKFAKKIKCRLEATSQLNEEGDIGAWYEKWEKCSTEQVEGRRRMMKRAAKTHKKE